MNRQYGTKWFTFYTKIRPWFTVIGVSTVITEFIEYTDIYVNNWWLLLYFLNAIAQPILALIVFAKSKGDYVEFVRFVKGVLLFETVSIAYSQGVKNYIQTEFNFGSAFVVFAIILAVAFFLWYFLNVKYFEKRIATTPNYTVNTTPFYQVPNTNSQVETNTEANKPRFCRMCGTKLNEGSAFCHKCGAKI